MITKDKKNGIIFGVCSGLAKYFNVDPIVVRLCFVITTLIWGIGLIPYLVLALLMPNEDGASL